MDTIMLKNIKKQDGFTLVELMVTLSLLGIVLALGYMYFNFGVQAFGRGEHRTIAQQAVRLTSDFITTELRFANEIEINPNPDENYELGYRYIEESGGSIIFRDEEGIQRTLANSQEDGMAYSIFFTSNVPDDVVFFDIEADDGLYRLETRVQALNLELYRTYSLEGELIKLNDGDGKVIKYKVPERD